jgi:HEAT repeat protein
MSSEPVATNMHEPAPEPILAVGAAANRRDVDYLIAALSDTDRLVRAAAAWHIGELAAKRAVPALLRNLNAHSDLVRNASVIALGKIGDSSVTSRLVEISQEDEAAMIRLQAIDSLAMLDHPRGYELLAELAIDPAALFVNTTRWSDLPLLRKEGARTRRWAQKWAAKRIRELHATQGLPILRARRASVGPLHRLRLQRTIRSLTREATTRR